MPKEKAHVDYTPVVEPVPARNFKRPPGIVADFPPETIAFLVTHPGVAVRVMTTETATPLINRGKYLRDGTYGHKFETAGPRLIEDGPDAGKHGLWAWYTEPVTPANELPTGDFGTTQEAEIETAVSA